MDGTSSDALRKQFFFVVKHVADLPGENGCIVGQRFPQLIQLFCVDHCIVSVHIEVGDIGAILEVASCL